MILALIGRAIGPVSTIVLLAYLSQYSLEFTAQFAVLVAYMQLSTAPLNPYTEHFYLKEIVAGKRRGLSEGVFGIIVLSIISTVLVYLFDQSMALVCIVPLFGIGHLFLKVGSATLRANKQNTLALSLEFSLRPFLLLLIVILMFSINGENEDNLIIAFGVVGVCILILALFLYAYVKHYVYFVNVQVKPLVTRGGSPWMFLVLGVLMVLVGQFEVFLLDKFANVEVLATYKVVMQIAAVCGVVTSLILMNNLRGLYTYSVGSAEYRGIYRDIRFKTLIICIAFILFFLVVAMTLPLIWGKEVWVLAAVAASIFAISSSFGPISNWFYSTDRTGVIITSLLYTLVIKSILFFTLSYLQLVNPITLILLFACGVLVQNYFLFFIKQKNDYA